MIPFHFCQWLLFGSIFLHPGIDLIQGHPHHHNPNEESSYDNYYNYDEPNSIGLVKVKSNYSFTETYDRLIGALSSNPNIRIVAQIDHTANAQSVGLSLPDIKLVVFGNPALGTPLMLQNQFTGLDLPQKLLVWAAPDDDNAVFVGYNSVTYLHARYPYIRRAESFETIQMALPNFAGTAAGVSPESIRDDDVMDRRDFYLIRRMNRGLFQRISDADFETTYNRLITALENAPPSIAFQVDHGANAPDNNLNPTRLVSFANPLLGTQLMQVNPGAGIDLPLKILVTQDDQGRVFVSTNRIGFLEYRHGLSDGSIDETLDTIRGAIMNFVRVTTTGE